MKRPLITFTSDFGLQDWFTGVVHGVLHGICPEARIADLTHDIGPGHIARGAFILEAAARDFPPSTVHLAVVDPGVGTARRALAVAAHGQFFVGPDNGLLEWALRDPEHVAHALEDDRWFRKPVSRTFHGRDVFAPVAAHIANGVTIDSFGPRVTDPVRIEGAEIRTKNGELEGRVMFIDRFGNALTNLCDEDFARAFQNAADDDLHIHVGTREIRGIGRSYGDAPRGALIAIMGSSGRLEIAMVDGDVSAHIGIGEGDPVTVWRA